MNVHEVIIYDRALSPRELARVSDYLMRERWRWTLNLWRWTLVVRWYGVRGMWARHRWGWERGKLVAIYFGFGKLAWGARR